MSVKKNVLIKIKGLRAGEGEDMELIVNGTCMKGGEKIYLSYEETDPDGSVYKCRIKLGPTEMVYTKTGLFTTELYYCVGEPYESVISTPYGRLDAEIVTESLEYYDTPDTLVDMRLEYTLSINGEWASDCSLSVVAEEIGA